MNKLNTWPIENSEKVDMLLKIGLSFQACLITELSYPIYSCRQITLSKSQNCHLMVYNLPPWPSCFFPKLSTLFVFIPLFRWGLKFEMVCTHSLNNCLNLIGITLLQSWNNRSRQWLGLLLGVNKETAANQATGSPCDILAYFFLTYNFLTHVLHFFPIPLSLNI